MKSEKKEPGSREMVESGDGIESWLVETRDLSGDKARWDRMVRPSLSEHMGRVMEGGQGQYR